MSKFDNLKKEVIPDPLTGGTQIIYTSEDGTFMMCIPDRVTPKVKPLPQYQWKDTDDTKTEKIPTNEQG